MTFTYGGDISTSPKDWVRFLIGDTDLKEPDNQLLTDEEILGLIGSETNLDAMYGIAADAADAIAAKFSKYPPTRIGGLSNIDLRRVVEAYERRAGQLRSRANSAAAIGTSSDERVGGIAMGGVTKDKAFKVDDWDMGTPTSGE